MIRYQKPPTWITYNALALSGHLAEAKAIIVSLQTIPYQKSWAEALQKIQLKMEVAGTSRIEGAEFTDRELDVAMKETADQMHTRSQKQARAALETYEWIATLPDDQPITTELVCEIHRRVVTGADDDHCAPGMPRKRDENVNFGNPRHRGCEGGDECSHTLAELTKAIRTIYQEHDPLIRALAAHYHLAAMHPFLDGNGRTARAVEALLLQRAGLRETCFVAMSNYYYEEKTKYLSALSEVRAKNHDLTPFLEFGLKGIAQQTRRLLSAIQHEMKKALFRNMAHDLFLRLQSPKKRVIAKRQLALLQALLKADGTMRLHDLAQVVSADYKPLKDYLKAITRDLVGLLHLGAIRFEKELVIANLDWPQEITETDFFERLKSLPRARTLRFFTDAIGGH